MGLETGIFSKEQQVADIANQIVVALQCVRSGSVEIPSHSHQFDATNTYAQHITCLLLCYFWLEDTVLRTNLRHIRYFLCILLNK
ncbi:hypothetical protein [Methyloglobulus sp.]|uniref:hypothetical protein n=1 Tax=Methyloglobulus sp. TaxID=2518622 RepID=UPI0032B7B18F